MIEAWQIPILTATLEFLFDTGRVLLNEIKIRREQNSTETPDKSDLLDSVETDNKAESADRIATKEQAFHSMISEIALEDREAEMMHLLELAKLYRENYRLAQRKYAKWGDALVPPIIMHELEDAENHLIETLLTLKQHMELILGKRIELVGISNN